MILRRRHSGKPGEVDLVLSVSDGRNLNDGIGGRRLIIARKFSKGSLTLSLVRKDDAFDNNFRMSRHLEVHRSRLDQLDGSTEDSSCQSQLIHSIGSFPLAGDQKLRTYPQRNGYRQSSASGFRARQMDGQVLSHDAETVFAL